MTLRSLSPKPQDLAAIGCWRILILYFELRVPRAVGCCRAGAFEADFDSSARDTSLLSRPDMLIRPASRGSDAVGCGKRGGNMAERGCDGSGRESRAGYVDNGGGGGGGALTYA